MWFVCSILDIINVMHVRRFFISEPTHPSFSTCSSEIILFSTIQDSFLAVAVYISEHVFSYKFYSSSLDRLAGNLKPTFGTPCTNKHTNIQSHIYTQLCFILYLSGAKPPDYQDPVQTLLAPLGTFPDMRASLKKLSVLRKKRHIKKSLTHKPHIRQADRA